MNFFKGGDFIAICGLDIGTTGCKITVYNEDGKFVFKAYEDYPVARNTGEHEVKAELIWEAVKSVIIQATAKFPEIKGIGVTSFGETFVMTDENDTPILPSMLYTDPRGSVECQELVEKLGERNMARISGSKPHSMYSIPKLMWVKKNKPSDYNRVKHVFLMEDYIVYMLTGRRQIDYSLASRTMAFDIRKLRWSREILEAAGVDEALLSTPVPTGTSAGAIKESMAEMLGLNKDTIVVSISHDQVAAAVGSSVFSANAAVDGAGTVECITPVFDGIPDNDVLFKGSYSIVPYVIQGKYVCYAFSFTGGALINWYVDNLAIHEKSVAKETNSSVYQFIEKQLKDEPTGIMVLPHFAGAATPYMDSGSKGAIVGLTLAHNSHDIYRAMMEGVVYEMLLNMEELNKAGIRFEMLRATGGGANSGVWLQMKADVLNLPVISLGSSEAGATGSAMLTGIAAGVFMDLHSAAEIMVREMDTYYPRQEKHEEYMKIFRRYRELYNSVRQLV